MKRSHINRSIDQASTFFSNHGWTLPQWAHWSPAELARQPDLASYLYQHQMGWDVTDFGSDRFAQRGLVLFCLRNGVSGTRERTYAEKLMMVQEGQETPLHYHKSKMEDIINRAGGTLVLEFYATDATGTPTHEPVGIRVDGQLCNLAPGEPLHLRPGQSVCIPQRTLHRFFAEIGTGTVLAGEVSQCNDDLSDNFFAEKMGRFSAIEEDEPARHALWNETGLA